MFYAFIFLMLAYFFSDVLFFAFIVCIALDILVNEESRDKAINLAVKIYLAIKGFVLKTIRNVAKVVIYITTK